MKRILLTDDELDELEKQFPFKSLATHEVSDAYCKAQLKKVKGKIAVVEIPKGKSAGYNVDGRPYIALAMLKEDWQSLEKEVE